MSRNPRLLIVSYHFPPAESVGARRPGALAQYAAAEGWDVRVLAGPLVAGAGTCPSPVDTTNAAAVRVTRSRMWFPERPVAAVRSAPGGSGRSATAPTRLVRQVNRLAREVLLLPDRQAGWAMPAVREFLRHGGQWRPDVIVASAPPFTGFVVARILAGRLGVPWVADYRDLWTVGNGYWPYGTSRLRRRLDHSLERRLVRSARSCVTVSEVLADTLRRAFDRPVRVVMNGIDPGPVVADRGPVAPGQTARVTGNTVLTLAHTGVHYPGRRDPTPLLRAMALLGPDRQRVRLILAGADSHALRSAVVETGTGDQVTILGPVPVAESWRIQAEADVLVLLMWNDPRDVGTVTGKLFDYLRTRHPILMLGYPTGTAAGIIRSRGAGVVCNDPRQIADQLRSWLAAKERDGALPQLPAEALDGLYREDQMRAFLGVLV